jgi:multidrug efflux pump subunit AcrA (membrane-fusion protein)
MNRAFFLAAALAAALSVWMGCSAPPEPEATAPPEGPAAEVQSGPRVVRLSAEAARAAGVKVAAVEPAEVADVIEVAGRVTLDEDRTARVGSFADGIVIDCCKSVGSYVRKGDVLVQVHSHATHEIVAEYTTTQAALNGRRSELEYARQARDRANKLLELKAGSLQAVQRAETDVQAAQAAVTAAEAAVHRAKAHLDFYGLDAEEVENPKEGYEPHIDIPAPMAGTIVERAVKLGDVVNPTSQMYVISDLSRVWVMAQVPEQHLGSMRPGMEVEVRTQAFPERGFPGRVQQVSSELDPDTMTVQVRCSVPNPGRALKTGMYATVRLQSDSVRSTLTVPEGAMQRIQDEPVVFVASGEGAFEIRGVREGRLMDGRVEILDGLREGERIAVEGAFVLKSEHLKAELTGEE